jgi:hypothetical protein
LRFRAPLPATTPKRSQTNEFSTDIINNLGD